MTWQDVTWHDLTGRDMTWRDVTWHDMTWRDVTWRDMTRHDVTWRDMTIQLTIKHWLFDRLASFARLLINLEHLCQGTKCLGNYENLSNRKLTWISRSLKLGSSVGMSAMDFLTSKTWIMKKFQKSTRHNHQYLRVPVEPEVYPYFRGHLNMVAL